MAEAINVLDVELSRPLEDITALDGYRALQALVRLHGTPVGCVTVPLLDGRCSATALRRAISKEHGLAVIRLMLRHRLAAPLPRDGVDVDELLRTPPADYSGPLPSVTVAVCTRDRTSYLESCLDSLFSYQTQCSDIIIYRKTLKPSGPCLLRILMIAPQPFYEDRGTPIVLRRSALAVIGDFDNALDLGAALPGGGDVDIIWRALDSGFEVIYEPRAVVLHEHRRELDEVYFQILGHRRTEIAFLTKSLRSARGKGRMVILAFISWCLLKPGFRLLRRLVSQDEPLPAGLLWQLWGASWRGLLSYGQTTRLAAHRAAHTVG